MPFISDVNIVMQIIGAMCSKVPLISKAVMKATGCGTVSLRP